MQEKKSKIRIFLAKQLSAFPLAKQFGAECLQRIKYLRYGLFQPKCISLFDVHDTRTLLPEKWKKAELYFGYYDKPAENNVGLVLLNACLDKHAWQKPSADSCIHVLVVDKNSKANNPLLDIKTETYNWQQGCRAQWLDDDLFIMNHYDSVDKRYISKVYSVSKKAEVKKFEKPVQDSYKKDYFLSINYQRLRALRPDYCYRNLPEPSINTLSQLDNDGIWKINYQTGDSTLLYSLKTLSEFEPNRYPEGALHKVNHLMISPNGSKFIMIHRYLADGKRNDRLILGEKDGGQLKMLANNGMVSHCSWVDDSNIIAYLRSPEGENSYFYIDVENVNYKKITFPLFNTYGDGHPSQKASFLISDTGSDRILHRHLICHNYDKEKTIDLGSFYQAIRFRLECRCDLHPRMSMDGNTLYFDSVFSGKRSLYYIDLKLLKE